VINVYRRLNDSVYKGVSGNTMRLALIIILLLSLTTCRQTETNTTSEQLELILVGLPQNFDTNDLSKLGSQKYFSFNGTDSLFVKSCTYIDERTGEPILPVTCNYYKKAISPLAKSQFDFFQKYLKPIENGELIKKRPEEVYCDLFGGWIAIYTGTDNSKKYFVFDCYGLPDCIRDLCSNLNHYGLDTPLLYLPSKTFINTDSIVQTVQKILDKEFAKRRPKSHLKFIRPE
jgi:hypothetical protein